MKLIITRPMGDALPLAQKLEDRGHEAIIAPLLKIEARDGVILLNKRYQAICITSANAFVSPELFGARRGVPLYCVGPQSAEAAKRAGFADVQERGGNVHGLAEAIARELRAIDGPLLYLSGQETSGDLQGLLAAQGFAVERIVAYDAVPIALTLSQAELSQADGVLLYSPRSARLWVEALAGRKVKDGFMHFCLSQNVARSLSLGSRIRIAQQPDEDHMLSLLDQAGEAE
jgi:uroporphyrinogen-III synthase